MKWNGLVGLLVCLAGSAQAMDRANWHQLYESGQHKELVGAVQPEAESGDAHAQFLLGMLYLNGEGVEHDIDTGIAWLERSADQGYALAQLRLGQRYIFGPKAERGTALLTQAAKQGLVEAQYKLGLKWLSGIGADSLLEPGPHRDLEKAHKWLRKAAEQGHPEAQKELGELYLEGKGVEADPAEAVRWALRLSRNPDYELEGPLSKLLNNVNDYFTGRVVKADTANVRAGPGTDHQVVAQLNKAKFVWALRQDGGWFEIKAHDTPLGWIHGSLLEPRGFELFGVSVHNAIRWEMREAVKEAGAKPVREKDQYWYDIYEADGMLEGASELSIGYTIPEGLFATLFYKFPSRMDKEKAIELKEMVASKYGPPDKQKGQERLGELSYTCTRTA